MIWVRWRARFQSSGCTGNGGEIGLQSLKSACVFPSFDMLFVIGVVPRAEKYDNMHILFTITYKRCNPRNQTESISTGIKHISFSCDKLLVSQWLTICERIWRSWPATMWNASVATLDESSKKEGWSKHWALCRSVTWSCCLKTFWQLIQTLHNLLFLYGKMA